MLVHHHRSGTVILALALLISACGTRVDRTEVEAAARGDASSTAQASGGDLEVAGADSDSRSEGAGTATADGRTPVAGTAGDAGVQNGEAGAPAEGAGDGAGGGEPSAAAPGTQAAEANGAPIRIGSVSTLSGPAGSAQAPGVRAAQAWASSVNAKGGINGHPVEYLVVDDGGDPARHVAAVRDLVENKGVIAFVSNWASQSEHASRAYLEEKQVPMIGGDVSIRTWVESPMHFPHQSFGDSGTLARMSVMKRFAAGKTKLATIVCREAQVCSDQASAIARVAPELGLEVVYQGQGSLAQPDFTAECLSARNAGAELVMPIFDLNSVRRIGQSCERQGFMPHYNLGVGLTDVTFEELSAFADASAGVPTFPFVGVDGLGPEEFRAAMKRYLGDEPLSPALASGWAAGKLFEKAAGRAFPPEAAPSSQALLQSLWQTQNETVDGLIAPVTYRQGQPAITPPCVFAMRIEDGSWRAPDGLEPTCV